MITKYTAFRVLSVERASGEVIREAEEIARTSPFIKQGHRHHFDYERRPGFIYVRSRAISSRTNDNYDNFPAAEIKKAWHTFIGKPVFVNHHNANHRRARGFIIDAALHEDLNPDGSPDTWAEVLMEVDAVRFPRLAEAVIRGDIARTSMGTDVQHSICTACGNRAETPADYCQHIPRMKGMKVRRFNAALGRQEEVLVAEVCYGLGFFENSLLVEEPADPTAYTLGEIEADWDTVPIQRSASKTAADPEWLINGKPYTDGVWIEVKPDTWYRGAALGSEIPSRIAVVRKDDKWVWEAQVLTFIGAPHEDRGWQKSRSPSGTAKTLEQAQAKALASLAKDHEFFLRYQERQRASLDRDFKTSAVDEGWLSEQGVADWNDYEVGFDDAQAGRKSVSQSKGYLLGFKHGLETKTASTPEERAEWREEWYTARENVTYTDGTRVREGDHIRYHQAPGGLLGFPSTQEWQYGTAVLIDSPVPGVKEMVMEANEPASWGGKEKYNLYGHVIERAEKKIGTLLGLQTATLLAEAEQITKDALGWGDVADFFAGGRDPRVQCMECGSTFKWDPKTHRFVCPLGHATFPYNLHDEDWDRAMASRTALNETKAPAQVDTLRADRCPVCKDDEGFNGEKCSVCGHVEPPEHFRDPDLTKAREMDLRQDIADEAGAVDPSIDLNAVPGQDVDTSISGEMGTETGDQGQPDLQCTNCGEVFSAEGQPEADAEDPQAKADGEPPGLPEDPTRPEADEPDDLDDLADKTDAELGLDDEVDEDEPDEQDPEAARHPEDVEPVDDTAVTQKPGPPEFGKEPGKEEQDPTAKPDVAPDEDALNEDAEPVIGPNSTCPICGVGTLEPMDVAPTAITTQDLDDQQVAEPQRQRV